MQHTVIIFKKQITQAIIQAIAKVAPLSFMNSSNLK